MNSPADADAEVHRVCSILESVANGFPPDSKERLAVRDAALAFSAVVLFKDSKDFFLKVRSAFDGVITDEIRADMLRLGIDPDEPDDACEATR